MGYYEARCPTCGDSVQCCPMDLMGFPHSEPGDEDPLKTIGEACGAVRVMDWYVTLSVEEQEKEE